MPSAYSPSFNPLDRVKFVQMKKANDFVISTLEGSNPLDRVKFVQMNYTSQKSETMVICFNPLDRVKFVQIALTQSSTGIIKRLSFQSPRSGQICLNRPLRPESRRV